jgi:hypothetical protein
MSEIKMLVGGATAVTPPLNEVKLYVKSDKRFYMQDDTGAEVKLLTDETTLASLSVQAPLLTTGGSNPTLSVSPVTATANGLMPFADKVKLNNATNANTGNTLVLRDASGNFSANQITATNFIGTASNVTTIPSLTGVITTTGLTNLTTLATGVIVNNNISASAGISISKLELDPTLRSNHNGTQSASTLTGLDTEIDAHLTNNSPITNVMIDNAAAIALSKLAVNPLNRALHTGNQLANTISDLDVEINSAIADYLVATPITNNDISNTANIALNKLAVNPIPRANHTGTQLASTISNFDAAVAAAITAGDALLIDSNGTIDVVGTADRITTNADSIDIAANYAGQSSISTLGTVTIGSWNANTISTSFGGTGATNPGAAAHNLLAITVVSANTTLNSNNGTVLVDATAALRTVTLPNANILQKYTIKKIDSSANTVVITPQVGNTVEGNATKVLSTQYETVNLISNGTTWYLV